LVWLGLKILRTPLVVSGDSEAKDLLHLTRLTVGTALRRGLFTNIGNPKALLFCSVLLPQFVHGDGDGDGHGIGRQFVVLGGVLVGLGLVFDVAYSFAGVRLGDWLARHTRAELAQRWIFAVLITGFGMSLAAANLR
jgi:threonine/homoserine/homoserine lactone efflux protein